MPRSTVAKMRNTNDRDDERLRDTYDNEMIIIMRDTDDQESRRDRHEGDVQQTGGQPAVHRPVRPHLGPPAPLQVVPAR